MDMRELELEIVWKILKIKEKYPQLRVGQIIHNSISEDELYYISDDKLLGKLTNYLDENYG